MKKRCASVILAAALIFALLSGCGTSPQPETGEPAVEATVISALLDQAGSGYYPGECVAEGHEILDIVREEDRWQVYLIASVGQYGFCTGHFEEISGSGAIPTRITFAEENGALVVEDYWQPEDGSYYADSIKETFPLTLQLQAFSAQDYYDGLKEQKQAYAAAYLRENFNQPVSMRALAAICGWSYDHFQHVFRREIGLSPQQYLIRQRLSRSAEMLREGSSCTDAAYACGFSSAAQFSTMFRRAYGVAPRDFAQGKEPENESALIMDNVE